MQERKKERKKEKKKEKKISISIIYGRFRLRHDNNKVPLAVIRNSKRIRRNEQSSRCALPTHPANN